VPGCSWRRLAELRLGWRARARGSEGAAGPGPGGMDPARGFVMPVRRPFRLTSAPRGVPFAGSSRHRAPWLAEYAGEDAAVCGGWGRLFAGRPHMAACWGPSWLNLAAVWCRPAGGLGRAMGNWGRASPSAPEHCGHG
jgi:hypothetical protein